MSRKLLPLSVVPLVSTMFISWYHHVAFAYTTHYKNNRFYQLWTLSFPQVNLRFPFLCAQFQFMQKRRNNH